MLTVSTIKNHANPPKSRTSRMSDRSRMLQYSIDAVTTQWVTRREILRRRCEMTIAFKYRQGHSAI